MKYPKEDYNEGSYSNKGKIINMSLWDNIRKNNDWADLKKTIEYLNNKIDKLDKKIEENKPSKNKPSKNKEKWKFVFGIGSFIFTLLTAFGAAFIYLDTQFSKINERIDDCLTEKDIKSLTASVKEIELWVKGDINDPNSPGANSRLEKIEDALNISPININGSIAMNNLFFTASMENESSNTNISLTSETYLGEDSEGNTYTVGDVAGENVLLTYNEDGKEVYFWGQLNEQLHWHGHCVTNTYNSTGTLLGVCESDFEDGVRNNYESFYLSDTDNDIWIYTNRTCEEEGNLGISEKYDFKYDKIKNFTNTNVRIYDLLYINDFSNSDDKVMLSYYSGYSVNGVYNDQSGDAYEILFYPDGIIRVLYIGKFLSGDFHDQTGNAREIVFDTYNNINKYFYYKGTFTEGDRDGKVSSNNYVTQAEIDEILTDKEFEIELNWYKTDDTL